jgi:PilZ domain
MIWLNTTISLRMSLCALLVTHDDFIKSAFDAAVRSVGGKLEVTLDSQSAREIIGEIRFDLVVIDCDDVYGGTSLVRFARASLPNRSSTILAITNGGVHPADVEDLGANIVASKPITDEQAKRELNRVWRNLEGDQRADRRFNLRIPVLINYGNVSDRQVETFNISSGGIGIRISEPIENDDLFHLRCCLPGFLIPIQAHGEIAWVDRDGNCGIKFLGMSEFSQQVLSQWLERADGIETTWPVGKELENVNMPLLENNGRGERI